MPPSDTQYRITPRARDDLIAIGRYTTSRWGRRQRDVYLKSIEQRFVWLAENPARGRHRPEIKDGYYCYKQGSHVIFYIIRGEKIDIIGVPHQRMDFGVYF